MGDRTSRSPNRTSRRSDRATHPPSRPLDRRRFLKITGAGFGATGIAGCGGDGNGDGGEDALEGETLTIGLLTLLPEQELLGESMLRSAEMAVDHINEGGGIFERPGDGDGVLGAELDVEVGDTQMSPSTGLEEHRRLTYEEEVDVTVGVFLNSVLHNVMDSIAEQRTLHITTGAPSPRVSQMVADDYDRYKYHFRAGPTNAYELSRAIGEFLELYNDDVMQWDSAAFLFEDQEAFDPFYETVQDDVADHVDVGTYMRTDENTTNWSPIYDNLESEGVDCAFVFQALSGLSSVTQWADQERAFEFGGLHLFSQFTEFWEETDGNTEYVFTMNSVTPQTENTEYTQPYMEEFVDRYGFVPAYAGTLTYNAVYYYAEAVRELGTGDPEELIPFLEEVEFDFSLISPTFGFHGRDAEYPHDPAWQCMEACDDPAGVPLWQQWQAGDDDEGVMECFAPDANKTADYQRPDWIDG